MSNASNRDIVIREDQNLLLIFNKLCSNLGLEPEKVILENLNNNIQNNLGFLYQTYLEGNLPLDPRVIADLEQLKQDQFQKQKAFLNNPKE